MIIHNDGTTVTVSGLELLCAANAHLVRAKITDSLGSAKNVDLDLSSTTFLDSCGIGTLVSLYKTIATRSGTIRLLNPTPGVQQILDLTRMHRLFQIGESSPHLSVAKPLDAPRA